MGLRIGQQTVEGEKIFQLANRALSHADPASLSYKKLENNLFLVSEIEPGDTQSKTSFCSTISEELPS